MRKARFLMSLLPLGAVLLCVGLLYLVPHMLYSLETIDQSVESICARAGGSGPHSCVERLSSVLDSNETGFRQKNEAVWALGQLADPRALPALLRLQTGIPCSEPCRKDLAVCQREVEKALRWCRGEAWLMRGMRRFFGSPW